MATLSTFGLNLPPIKKTHLVTLSWDDGFRKSFHKTADIFEANGLRACFNVIATANEEDFQPRVGGKPDVGIVGNPMGTFTEWNALKRRGHEVMAHTYNHANLTEMPLDQAKADIDKCAAYFEKHLKGFKARDSVYNFAYNASTPELDAYVLTKFLVARTQGDSPVNPIPTHRNPVRIGCYSHGPECCDDYFESELVKFLQGPSGWFVFNTHGLDGEGWGPMTSKYLDALLKRLGKLKMVEVVSPGVLLNRLSETLVPDHGCPA